ncbi:uncharacterized protein LOC108114647 isoform X2 [Drosophila eugracilis]|uniref:uncharacterized protein LOC108114647 isoform X2 n=1 Tax=Drosophila eugracilis TaxID=29029 RepID=UPI001BDA5BF3|nr:uncharacterized protein LOC108114647 isoform X2 [Drosophila eugracilis]
MVKRKSKELGAHKNNVELLTEDEWMQRKNVYMQRLTDLRTSAAFIEDATHEYKELRKQQMDGEKWNTYLACDGLPDPSRPDDIRKFVHQLNFLEKESCAKDISWALPVDERSILSHAPDRKDMTRRNLEKTRPNMVKLYDDTVQRILETISRVERVLRNDDELLDLPTTQALDLAEIPAELHGTLDKFFDKLTYRVICSPEAYMILLSNYCYNCSNFDLQIWGLQDVPIRFNYMKLPLMCSDLNCVGVTLQLPLSVLCDNLTLRCVHTFFDPFSQLAKSSELDITGSMTPNCGLVDIGDSVMTEWMTQMDIQEDLMNQMSLEMQKYEEGIVAYVEAEAKRKKDPEKSKKKSTLKPPKMPQELPIGMFPDPYKIFLEHEKRDCTDFFKRNFHPDQLNLLPFEVNNRKFIIMGGVISLVFVRKAKHTAFEKFNITLHEDGRVLRKELDVLDESHKEFLSTKFSTLPSPSHPIDLNTEDASEFKLHLEPDELPFYFLTFKMPNHLCVWGEPMACQFVQHVIESQQVVENILEKLDKKKKPMRKNFRKSASILPKVSTPAKAANVPDENVEEMPKTRYHQPALQSSLNIYRPSALAIMRQSLLEPGQGYQNPIKNVDLKGVPLTKTNLELLRKHCLPRIISSFKFPREFVNDELEEQAIKKPAASAQLYRRRGNDSALSEQIKDHVFSYEEQSLPERFYPVFPTMEPLQLGLERSTKEDTSMYGLFRTLDDIKDKYEDAHKKIDDQTVHTVRMSRRFHPEPSTPSRTIRQGSFSRRSTRQFGLDVGGISEMRLAEIEYDPSITSDSEPQRKIRKNDNLQLGTPRSSEPRKVFLWSTEFILESEYDKESKVLTVKTNRLGNFGFAYLRYTHFPFRHWELEKNEENPDELVLTLDTHHVRVVFFISKDGFRCYAIDIPKEYIARPYRYIDIEKPIADFVELRKRLQDRNLNVFAEQDACFYIDQGYFSQKHLAAEYHIYDVMTVHAKLIKFSHNQWNRLAAERDIVLCLRNIKDVHEASEVTVRVTPESSTFVEISEYCTDDLKTIKLNYKKTWRNIGTYSDLHQLINSMYPHATDMRNRDANQMYYLRQLLQEIRPLSFS